MGEIGEALGLNPKDPMAAEFERSASKHHEKERARRRREMSPPDSLNLAPLLEKRRQEWDIPDCYFKHTAVFGWCYVAQIDDVVDEGKFQGTSIVVPDLSQDVDRRRHPRGVLISAGLLALDYLFGQGVELGSIVRFMSVAPYEMRVGLVGGKEERVRVLNYTDCAGCDDLAVERNDGELTLYRNDDTGEHSYVRKGIILKRLNESNIKGDH